MSDTPTDSKAGASDAPRLRVANRRRLGWMGVVLRGGLVLPLVLLQLGGWVAFGLYAHHAREVTYEQVTSLDPEASSSVTRFLSADGELVGEWFVERRIGLSWEELPRTLVLAFLAAEDARFFAHDGIYWRGLVRAVLRNLFTGSRVGGSTITQQVAKMVVGSRKSLARKVHEAVLARRMEDVYTKEQILTIYLNSIYLGHHSYGVQAAAQNYFHKDVRELNLAEMAMIAGLPQRPSKVNPVVNMKRARKRMGYVLAQMKRWGWITAEQEAQAAATDLVVHPRADLLGDKVPYYTEIVRRQIEERYGREDDEKAWLRHNLSVSLAVQPGAQSLARAAVGGALERVAKLQGYPGALARMERDKFFDKNTRWLGAAPPSPGQRRLAWVSAVEKRRVTAWMSPALVGSFGLKATKWAGPYSEFPRDPTTGRYDHIKTTSYKPKLRDMRKAFAIGDVVLVEVKGGPPDSMQLELVPIPLMEAALVSCLPAAGGVDAAVAGWDFDRSQVDRLHAPRQTGSTMKAIVYAKAYDVGMALSTVLSGAPVREGTWAPSGKKSKRDMTAWDALTQSARNHSIRVLQYVLHHTSLEDYREWGRQLGLPRELEGNPAEPLGGDQTVAGMARAFGTFALGGLEPRDSMIRKVVDGNGRVLERNIEPLDPHATLGDVLIALWDTTLKPRQRRIPETSAWLITANLHEVVRRGTGRRARKLKRSAAGKTGTLDFDAWFNGYTSERVAVVWVGADRRERWLGKSKRKSLYGGVSALPAWLEFMQGVDTTRRTESLTEDPPNDIVRIRIDSKTGLRAGEGGVKLPHRKGTEPAALAPSPVGPSNVGEIETEF